MHLSDWAFSEAPLQDNHDQNIVYDTIQTCIQAVERMPSANVVERKTGKWIPVTERLPENDQDVLVMVHWRDYPENMMCYGRKYKTRWYLWNGELGELIKGFDITHWMQLPQPPEEE